MSMIDSTTEDDRRHRASQRSRAHVVTTGQCPSCGEVLPAGLVAAIKRGDPDAWCYRRFR